MTKPSGDRILRKQAIGFYAILALSWVTELIHLPYLLFDEPFAFSWTRVLLRSAVVLVIWFWVHLTTKRMLKRLHELEEFLLICSWCRKVGHEGEWLTTEEYFDSNFKTETSHGICPACAQQQLAKHAAFRVVPPKADRSDSAQSR